MNDVEKTRKAFDKAFPASVLSYRAATDSWQYEQAPISQKELVSIVALRLGLGNQFVSNFLVATAFERRYAESKRITAFVTNMDREEPDDSELRRFLALIEHAKTPDLQRQANVVAMKQWLWMVKRHAVKKEVSWHVAPVFWSTENGTGKSGSINRLMQPFAGFTRTITSLSELSERFSGRLFASTLIVFLDEFAGAEKANTAQLKAILTGAPIDKRSMHSESGFYAENRMSCIATSNLRPPHGFVDNTGARRFWSIRCSSQSLNEHPERKALFESIDFGQVWRAVSIHEEAPTMTCDDNVKELMIQVRESDLRSKSSLESFVVDALMPAPEKVIPFGVFRARYNAYCASTNEVRFTGGRKQLREALEGFGLRCTKPGNLFFIHDMTFCDDENGDAVC